MMKYADTSDRFLVKQFSSIDHKATIADIDKICQSQYWNMYNSRLKQLRPLLEQRAKQVCGNVPLVSMAEATDGHCVLIGVIQNISRSKPSILKILAQEQHILAPEKVFIAEPMDVLRLLDDNQRTTLFNVQSENYLTGMVCALRGNLVTTKRPSSKDSCFYVEECLFACPKLWTDIQLERRLISNTNSPLSLMFISGLEISNNCQLSFEHQLICDLVSGIAGDNKIKQLFSRICKIVVVGSSLYEPEQLKKSDFMANILQDGCNEIPIESLSWLDILLSQLSIKSTDVQPGSMDPTDALLPRQPLDRNLFPILKKQVHRDNCRFTTNPYEFELNDIRFLGICGSIIEDIKSHSGHTNSLDIVDLLLKIGHVYPTAPETLGCFPTNDTEDCFILSTLPDVLYVHDSSCTKPTYRWYHSENGRTLVLLLPSFSKTKIVTMLSLCDFTVTPVKIEVDRS
ncbi:hypothetical protein GJ496_001355 [Pomphorhynchus laevis]|nr:hypothetical protein GJ496_001355 [Pomphorhynchus laevis]